MLKLILTVLTHPPPPADRHSEKWLSSCQCQMELRKHHTLVLSPFVMELIIEQEPQILSKVPSIIFWVMTVRGSQTVAMGEQQN